MAYQNPSNEMASPGPDQADRPGYEENKGAAADDAQNEYQQRIADNHRESGEAMMRRVDHFTESYADDMKELHKRIKEDAEYMSNTIKVLQEDVKDCEEMNSPETLLDVVKIFIKDDADPQNWGFLGPDNFNEDGTQVNVEKLK